MKFRSFFSSTLIASAVATILSVGQVQAANHHDRIIPESVSAELSAGYDSRYIFRGASFGEHLVWTGTNLAVSVMEDGELSVGTWYASTANTDYDELNVVGGASWSFGDISVGLGVTWYHFPRGGSDVVEPNANIGLTSDWVDLSFLYAYDTQTNGSYLELGASRSFEINDWFSLEPSLAASWADSYYGVSGFNHVQLGLAGPIALSETATLTPYISGSFSVDALEDIGGADFFWGGVNLSVSF